MTQSEAHTASAPPKPKTPEPCAIVIFGAFGDLTKRLVMPALYNLARDQDPTGEFRHHRRGCGRRSAQDSWADHLHHHAAELCRQRGNSEFNVDAHRR